MYALVCYRTDNGNGTIISILQTAAGRKIKAGPLPMIWDTAQELGHDTHTYITVARQRAYRRMFQFISKINKIEL
jgi:hypothetical protein